MRIQLSDNRSVTIDFFHAHDPEPNGAQRYTTAIVVIDDEERKAPSQRSILQTRRSARSIDESLSSIPTRVAQRDLARGYG